MATILKEELVDNETNLIQSTERADIKIFKFTFKDATLSQVTGIW